MKAELSDYVLPLDKPVGPTSHDLVAITRRALKTRRVGHTGTLDPFASGLMLVCVNRATRIAEYLTGLDKSYEATLRLDAFTDTDDCTGTLIETSDRWQSIGAGALESAATALTGSLQQIPPKYSAKKLAGKRAYDLARTGVEFELERVAVTVQRFQIKRVELPEVEVEVDCSSGTYIRALARDLGLALGTGGHLTALRRTRVGSFELSRALTAAQLDDPAAVQDAAIDLVDAMRHFPLIEVSAEDARRLQLGQSTSTELELAEPVVVVFEGRLLAMARSEAGRLRPTKVWPRE